MSNTLEISESYDLEKPRQARGRHFIVTRTQAVLFVVVVLLLIVVTGILVAMFGPGSTDLKYHEPSSNIGGTEEPSGENCEGDGKNPAGVLECDVAILGGGLAGLYMADSLLSSGKETNVCVFEKEGRFGGRILDHRFPQVPNVTVGMGAWRVGIDATNMMNLMRRLNIPHNSWNFNYPTLLESRGVFTNNSINIKRKAFPTLNFGKFANMTSNEMSSYAFMDDRVATAPLFASVDTYMSHYLTPEGAEFLSELYGFKGDYTEPINPAAYIEYLKLTFALSDKYQRPFKGMSAFIEGLVASVKLLGGKLYKNNGVTSMGKDKERFVLATCTSTVFAKKIVVATHPVAFMKVKGSVAEQIHREPVFQSIQIMPAFKGAAVYKEAWWEENLGGNLTLKPRQRFISNSNCMGLTMPHGGRGPNGEAVLHTMYMDGACSRKWGDVLKISKSAVDREVKRALEFKFRGLVPDPLDTVYQYWDEGAWLGRWAYNRGAYKRKFTGSLL